MNIQKGYKNSPIGIIPEDWEVKKIKDIGKISSGTTPLRVENKYYINGIIHWVKTTDLNNSRILKTEEKVSEIAIKETSLKIYPENTVLVAMYGGYNQIGRTGLLAIKAAVNQALTAISTENVYPFFLLEWLNLNVGLWKNFAGSSRKDPNITSKDVGDFPIALPPLPEQRRIATLLSTWDKGIDTLSALLTQLQNRKKYLAQQLLSGKKRLEGFEREWKEDVFGNVITRITRKNDIENTNVVTISAQRGFVKQEDFFTRKVASEILTGYYLIKKGEFAYNKSYSNGYPMGAFKRLNDFDFGVVTTLYICFSINNGYNSDFLVHYFENGFMNVSLSKIAQEGGRAHGLLNIGLSDFLSLKIKLPTHSEQTAIAQVLDTAEREIQLITQQLEALKRQKKD